MSQTPRTDAVIEEMAHIPRGMGDNELREHARQLERENMELRKIYRRDYGHDFNPNATYQGL